MAKTKYVAEWISKDFAPPNAEWNPDLLEYSTSEHKTRPSAERAARAGARKGPMPDWWRVAKEEPSSEHEGLWDTVAMWVEGEKVHEL
jgi:hypothetical protein